MGLNSPSKPKPSIIRCTGRDLNLIYEVSISIYESPLLSHIVIPSEQGGDFPIGVPLGRGGFTIPLGNQGFDHILH